VIYTQAKRLIQYWRAQLAMECDNTRQAIRTIVQLTERAEAAEAMAAQLQAAVQWYADRSNYEPQVDAHGLKRRPIMVLKWHKADVALERMKAVQP